MMKNMNDHKTNPDSITINNNEITFGNQSSCKEFPFSNFLQLSRIIKEIFQNFSSLYKESDDQKFNVEILYFKKISNERIDILLKVNDKNFNLYYEFLGRNNKFSKQEKKELCGNLVEEIIEQFQPLNSLVFHSDNMNLSGNYTMKYLVTKCQFLKTINLSNIFFSLSDIPNDFNNPHYHNENISFIQKIKECSNLENISLNFIFTDNIKLPNNELKFNDSFVKIMNSIATKKIKNIDLCFYTNTPLINSSLTQMNKEGASLSTCDSIQDIKISLINYDMDSKVVTNINDKYLLLDTIHKRFLPEFIEINFVDITNNLNSEVEENTKIFRFNKMIYTKRFFCIFNSIKNLFLPIKKSEKKEINNLNFNKIFDNIKRFLFTTYDQLFESISNNLKLTGNKAPIKNDSKYVFNLINDYKSILGRKKSYEDIFKLIFTKPTTEDLSINYIKLKDYDLNTISKIFSKIEGNATAVMQNGNRISVGGKIARQINNKESYCVLNTIIEVNRKNSLLKIITFSDNYFIPHYNAATVFLNQNYIFVVGGISTNELILNFVNTPIYKVNLKTYEIDRIIPSKENKMLPGIIFNHKASISSNNQFIKISNGFKLMNYGAGLNVFQDLSKDINPVVEENTNVYFFNLNTLCWSLEKM